MSRYVNPFSDIGFKVIFGQSASKEVLITLLNELLAGEHHIQDVTFLDKEDHAGHVDDKGIIYDLFCRTDSGEYVIVEMQYQWHSNFLDRTLYYVCRAMGRQIEAPHPKHVPVPHERGNMVSEAETTYGSRYKLDTVYGVFLMNFKEKGLEAKFRTDTVIADRETGKVVNPHFRQIYLQFPYFTKELEECDTLYDKLIYALKNMSNWNRMPDALKEQVFQHLEQLAAVANLSEENRIAYDKALDRFRVNRIVEEDNRREAMEKGMEKGMKEGMEKGMKEGMKEGEKKGRKEGREEEKRNIATQLKKQNIPVDVIAKATGLSCEEIEKL